MPLRESPQAVKQHAVPQNIMQVEFKIIGELTMRQFMYLLVFSAFALAAFRSGLPSLISLPLAAVLAFGGVAFAFIPIQERGMDQWIINFLNAIYTPTQRIWMKNVEPPSYFSYHSVTAIKTEMLAVAPTASRRKLEQFLEYGTSEKSKDPLDVMDTEDRYIMKVREVLGGSTAPVTTTYAPGAQEPPIETLKAQAFRPQYQAPPAPPPSVKTFTRTEEQIIEAEQIEKKAKELREAKAPPIPTPPTPPQTPAPQVSQAPAAPTPIAMPQPPVAVVKEQPKVEAPVVSKPTPPSPEETIKAPPQTKEAIFESIEKLKEKTIKEGTPRPIQEKPAAVVPPTPASQPVPPPAIEIPKVVAAPMAQPKVKAEAPPIIHEEIRPVYSPTFETVTPDRLTGRRFTHLTRTEGEIILPIRGERVLQTVEEIEDEDINKKANDLLALVEKVKKEQDKFRPVKAGEQLTKEEIATQKPISEVAQAAMTEITSKNEELAKQIEALKVMAGGGKTEAEKEAISMQIKNLQSEKFQADEQIKDLRQQIADLQEKLSRQGTEAPKVVVQKVVEKVHVPIVETEFEEKKPTAPPQKATFASAPPLTNVPNVINGIVKDNEAKLVESAVVIVKDARGDTVRALKTNKLGQFAITTPVANGVYVIEVSKPSAKLEFNPVSIELRNQVLPPMEITGKLSS